MLDELFYDGANGWMVMQWIPDGYETERHAIITCADPGTLDEDCVYACDCEASGEDEDTLLITRIGEIIGGVEP